MRKGRKRKENWRCRQQEGGEQTILALDYNPNIVVNGENDEIAENVSGTNNIKDIRIIERDSFRDLHQAENDGEVGTVKILLVIILIRFLRALHHCWN